jgi:hypothetical protein
MVQVCKSGGEGTFGGTRGNGEVAPKASFVKLHSLGRVCRSISRLYGADQPAREADQDRREGRQPRRYVTFQITEVAVSRQMFANILSLITRLRAPPKPA